MAPYIKYWLVLISCARGFNLRFNSAVKIQLLVLISKPPHNQLKVLILSNGGEIAPCIKFGFILMSFT
jgi:hypothetical protein